MHSKLKLCKVNIINKMNDLYMSTYYFRKINKNDIMLFLPIATTLLDNICKISPPVCKHPLSFLTNGIVHIACLYYLFKNKALDWRGIFATFHFYGPAVINILYRQSPVCR